MYIVYLESFINDIEWMKLYYNNIFPAGKKQASIHIKTTEQIIINHPHIGQVFDGKKNIRELVINKTPFSFLYRINEDRIEILRLWDQRRSRGELIKGSANFKSIKNSG